MSDCYELGQSSLANAINNIEINNSENWKILIVDDESMIHENLKIILSEIELSNKFSKSSSARELLYCSPTSSFPPEMSLYCSLNIGIKVSVKDRRF